MQGITSEQLGLRCWDPITLGDSLAGPIVMVAFYFDRQLQMHRECCVLFVAVVSFPELAAGS